MLYCTCDCALMTVSNKEEKIHICPQCGNVYSQKDEKIKLLYNTSKAAEALECYNTYHN